MIVLVNDIEFLLFSMNLILSWFPMEKHVNTIVYQLYVNDSLGGLKSKQAQMIPC